jgi:tetratricopeptide (TPR) repeat protein
MVAIANTERSLDVISITRNEIVENPTRVIEQLIQQEREFLRRDSAGFTGEIWNLHEKNFAIALKYIIIGQRRPDGNFNIDTKQLIALLKQLQQKYPDSGLVNCKLAETLATDRQFTAADQTYQQAIAKQPAYLAIIKNFALFKQSRQEFKVAEALLESGVAAHPQNIWAYINATTVSQQQNYKFKLFERAVAAMPDQEATYEEFSQLFINKVFDYLVTAGRRDISYANNPKVFRSYVKDLYTGLDLDLTFAAQRQNTDDAIRLLQAGKQKFPKNARIYAAMGVMKNFQITPGKISLPNISKSLMQGLANEADPKAIYAWLGDLDSYIRPNQALAFYQKAVNAGGDFCEAGYRYKLIFNIPNSISRNSAKPIKSEKIIELANLSRLLPLIEKSLKSPQNFLSQSTCFFSLWLIKEFDPKLKPQLLQAGKSAIPNFARTLQDADPNNHFVTMYFFPGFLMKWMIEEKQYAEAIQLGEQLFTKFPRAWELMFLVGQVYQETQQWTKATDAYQRSEAVTLKELTLMVLPNQRADVSAMHRWQLGLVAEAIGDIDAAINHFQLATLGLGNNLPYISTIYLDVKESWRIKTLAHNRLGEIFLRRGQKTQAMEQFKAAIKEESKYQPAIDNLKKAQQL